MGLLFKLKNGDTDLKSLRYGNDKPGNGNSGQPFIKTPIPPLEKDSTPTPFDGFVRGGSDAPKAAATDVTRLSKFLFSFNNPNGLLFTAKQNVLSRVAPKTETSFGAGYGGSKKSMNLDSGIVRKGPAGVNGGIYTPLSTIAQAGVGWLGNHLNKQGLDPTGKFPAASVNKYQEVAFENNRLINNNHTPDIPIKKLDKLERLENKRDRQYNRLDRLDQRISDTDFKFIMADSRYNKRIATPAKNHFDATKLKPEGPFKPNFGSRQLLKLGIKNKTVANNSNPNTPIPSGNYPIVPLNNPNNVQGTTFSQQGVITGRRKNQGYNNLIKKKAQLLDSLSEKWKNGIDSIYYANYNRLEKKKKRLELNRKPSLEGKIKSSNDAIDALQKDIENTYNEPRVFENRLLSLWDKTGLEFGTKNMFPSSNLLIYGGGPGSALGIGKTTIKFATLNDGITPYRTGHNSRRRKTDYTGFKGMAANLIKKGLGPNQQYNWKGILEKSVSTIYNYSDYNLNGPLINVEDLFDPKNEYKYIENWDNSEKETVNHEGFMPWAYDTPKTPTQESIDLELSKIVPNVIQYENNTDPLTGHNKNVTFNIRQTGDAGTKESQRTVINKINATKVLSSKPSIKDDYRAKNKIGDFVEFTIGLTPGDKTGETKYLTFPSFIDGYSDSFNADYKSVNYMGRPEPFYKYGGFKRDIGFSFTVVAQSKQEIGNMYAKLNFLATSVLPSYTKAGYMTGNLVYLTFGNLLVDQPGIINGFSFDIPEEASWDIGLYRSGSGADEIIKGDGPQMPMMIKVNGFKFTPLYDKRPEWGVGTIFGNEDIINVTDSSNWTNTKRKSEIEYNTQMTEDEKNTAAIELLKDYGIDLENPFGLPNIDYNE